MDILLSLSDHFTVPIDLLLSSDIPKISEIKIDSVSMQKKIMNLFPIFSDENAGMHFQQAVYKHRLLVKEANLNFGLVVDCLFEYDDAIDAEEAIEAFVANTLGLLMLLGMSLEGMNAKRTEAAAAKFIQPDSFEDEYKKSLRILGEMLDSVDCFEYLSILKHSGLETYRDLSDFYLGMSYMCNIVKTNLPLNMNVQIGAHMLRSFHAMGNRYVANYRKFAYELLNVHEL